MRILPGSTLRFATSTALASMAVVAYGVRGGYAGSCTLAGPDSYSCTGLTATGSDTTQSLNGIPLSVTLADGFGIETATGDAFDLNGTGGLSFTDTHGASITGGERGIDARNFGLGGALSVTTTGTVRGTTSDGINARNNSDTTDLTISAAAVTGGTYGIRAENRGTGALSITATGAVEGNTEYGIVGLTLGSGLTISAAEVSGGLGGIMADNFFGTGGAVTVTATGQVSGDTYYGILASNRASSGGTDLTISAAGVTGGWTGIYAKNTTGTGVLSVTATGAVEGTAVNGIYAYSAPVGTDLTISAAAVTGGTYGIRAENRGTGALSITATGAVVGGTEEGIATFTGAGGNTVITLEDGGSASAASGVAITNDAGDSTVTVKAGANVAGAVQLGDGADALDFAGGDFAGVTAFDGGDGAGDVLSFSGGATGTLDASLVTGFEEVAILASGTVSIFDVLAAPLSVAAGGTLAPGASPGLLTLGGLDVAAGGLLSFELGGLTAGTEYDVIDVTGTATLADGALFEILSFGSFVPSVGDSFDILIADTIVGSAANWSFDFQIGGTWDVSVVENTGHDVLRLSRVELAPIPLPAPLLLLGGAIGAMAAGGALRRRRAASGTRAPGPLA